MTKTLIKEDILDAPIKARKWRIRHFLKTGESYWGSGLYDTENEARRNVGVIIVNRSSVYNAGARIPIRGHGDFLLRGATSQLNREVFGREWLYAIPMPVEV